MGCRFSKREITVKKDTTYSTVVGIFLSVTDVTKLERFLARRQYAQRTLLYYVN